jgi:hypothetical protein
MVGYNRQYRSYHLVGRNSDLIHDSGAGSHLNNAGPQLKQRFPSSVCPNIACHIRHAEDQDSWLDLAVNYLLQCFYRLRTLDEPT